GIDERMQHLIQDLQNESKGPVHIGASYTYGEYILPKMIAQLIRRHPGIKPDVSISNSASIIRMVDSHDLDIGIIEDEERETDKNLNITRLIRDRMYIIGNRYTPDSLDNKALGAATWIVREDGSGTRSYQDQLFSSLGINPETITLSSTQAVKSTVTNGLGLTLLSHYTVGEELKTGSLKIINGESTELTRYFHLLTPGVKFHSKSTRTMVDMLNEDSIENHHFETLNQFKHDDCENDEKDECNPLPILGFIIEEHAQKCSSGCIDTCPYCLCSPHRQCLESIGEEQERQTETCQQYQQ